MDKPEEEDFSPTPYTDYGTFDEDKEEEDAAHYFQNGRFFGVSAGIGLEAIDGNRGTLYQGGFPMFDAKVHYWFDFNFALDMDFYLAQHHFSSSSTLYDGNFNVSIMRLGLDLKYYFDVKNLSAAISFANPYIVAGVGSYTESISSSDGSTSAATSSTAVGYALGAGFEFALKPKSVYFTLEGKVNFVQFEDYNTNAFQASDGLANLNGNFYTFVASLLFTW